MEVGSVTNTLAYSTLELITVIIWPYYAQHSDTKYNNSQHNYIHHEMVINNTHD